MRTAYLRVTKEMDEMKLSYENQVKDLFEEISRLKMVVQREENVRKLLSLEHNDQIDNINNEMNGKDLQIQQLEADIQQANNLRQED